MIFLTYMTIASIHVLVSADETILVIGKCVYGKYKMLDMIHPWRSHSLFSKLIRY